MVFHPYLIVALLALFPITETKGAIIYGIGTGLDPYAVLAIALAINIAIIPVIFFFLRQARLREIAFKFFRKSADKQIKKHSHKYDILRELALFGYVAIPLPFTGIYTGAIISELLGWHWKRSFVAMAAGVVVASTVLWAASIGVIKLISL